MKVGALCFPLNIKERKIIDTCDGENGRPLMGESFGVLGSLFIFRGDGVNIGEGARPCSAAVGVLGIELLGSSCGSDFTTGSVLMVTLVF